MMTIEETFTLPQDHTWLAEKNQAHLSFCACDEFNTLIIPTNWVMRSALLRGNQIFNPRDAISGFNFNACI